MSIDAVRSTGDQSCEVFSCDLVQSFRFVWENGADVGDLVLEVAPQDFDVEDVAEFNAVEVVEHGCASQSRVAGEDRVGSFAADGERGSKEVSNALFKSGGFGAVVDGKADVGLGDLHGRHDGVDVQL